MRPTIFQIKEAIIKNTCPPDDDEKEDLSTSKVVRTSIKREGDAELGMILLIGISHAFGYSFNEISLLASVGHDEYEFKLGKYQTRSKLNNTRFINKIKLINNYLRLKYGVSKVLPVGQR